MSFFHQATSWIRHWLLAVDQHSLHEPFIFQLYNQVIKPSLQSDGILEIEQHRASFRKYTEKQKLSRLGAASKQGERSLSQLAYSGSMGGNYALLLTTLIRHLELTKIYELGTSLGFTSLYLSHPPGTHLSTFEGDPLLITKATSMFSEFNRSNIHLIPGNIDSTLPSFLQKSTGIDFMLFDANHRYEPTLRYFQLALQYANENSVFVFDDIHWSKEMSAAWSEIIDHERVTLSLDLGRMGIVFFLPLLRKYHYYLMA